MRRLGYGEHRGNDGQYSYARRLSGALFPRYHVYVEAGEAGITVSLHIDQKEPSYHGTHAHAGEYDGKLVEQEMGWIASQIKKMQQAPKEHFTVDLTEQPDPNQEPKKKKGFWGSLFG